MGRTPQPLAAHRGLDEALHRQGMHADEGARRGVAALPPKAYMATRSRERTRMKWPRGRYNGQRIAGFEIKLRLDVFDWGLAWPNLRMGTCLRFGPLRLWISAAYEHLR